MLAERNPIEIAGGDDLRVRIDTGRRAEGHVSIGKDLDAWQRGQVDLILEASRRHVRQHRTRLEWERVRPAETKRAGASETPHVHEP